MTDQPRKFSWEFWLPLREFWIPLIVGVAAVFWFLLIPSWHNVIGHLNAKTWASEKGLVTASETYTFLAQERTQTGYHFRYIFEVNGVSYESGRYSFRNANGDEPVAVKMLGKGETKSRSTMTHRIRRKASSIVIRRLTGITSFSYSQY